MSFPRVMIIDDFFISRQIIANVMQQKEIWDVEVARNGRAGLDAIEAAHKDRKPFDIVFIDHNMPEMEGVDVVKHFRSKREYDNTAFIMISAESRSTEILKAIKAGADVYLTKPVSTEKVAAKFDEILAWLLERRQATKSVKPTKRAEWS